MYKKESLETEGDNKIKEIGDDVLGSKEEITGEVVY